MDTEEISNIYKTESSVPLSTSCTGSWPGFSRSPKHCSSVGMSAMDFLTSETWISERLYEEMKIYDSIWDTIINMSSSTSFTGSWSEFLRPTELPSSVCLSLSDFPPSKTYKQALKFEVFWVFLEKNYEKRKNVMIFLTGLCQDDVTTSSGDVISRKRLNGLVRDKLLGKVVEGIFKICHGSGVMQQKVGPRVNLPPLVLCVLTLGRPGGLMQPPLAFFPCNIFYDSNRKNRLSVSVTRDGRHILTYVTSSWRCHVTYVMTSYVHCTWRWSKYTVFLP